MWNEFLPISMPITAGEVSSFCDMGVLLVFGAPRQHALLAGREHGRTIPLAELSLKIRSEVKRTRRPGQPIVEPRSMPVAESDLLSYSCRVVGAGNVESNCRLGLGSVLRHCAVGAGRLRA